MKVYNTLTKQKEDLTTIIPNLIKMYACGPTVYNLIHIGNARPICVFDTARRFYEFMGYDVNFVQNFTDVDDKIIAKANEEGVTSLEISERYIAEYKIDATGLNVREATTHPKVTENIGSIIDIIKTLVEKEYAYEINGDVYFNANKFNEYGKLSNMPLEDLEAGARVSANEIKKDAMDFALWKSAKPGEPYWESPWGNGRPGWHIECSAMAKKYLGDTIDIHCGGQDLIFPHHENEIAQSECANDKAFANYWMHNGYINVDNKKMSKSKGNFFTVRTVAEEYGYEPIRFMMLQAHYRSPINYSTEIIEQCKSALERLYTCKENMELALANAKSGELNTSLRATLLLHKDDFISSMEDDLNTADAISNVFELVRDINSLVLTDNTASKETLEFAMKIFTELTDVLGLMYTNKTDEIPPVVLALLEKRKEARAAKDFALADSIRNEITAQGYEVSETRQGTKVTKI